jgi:ATP-dependent helicase/nuclease subunit A
MCMTDLRLPFEDEPRTVDARIDARDREGRRDAVDPRVNVALEASAGTGKTRVLVDRYVNLLKAGVDPSEIVALTFTRKAATEMRERIVSTLRNAAARGEIPPARWRDLRDRTAEVDISTIDAFCLSLLREFPLEANLDPGFQMADDTEVPRLIDEALDRALRTCRHVAREDPHVALVFAQLGDRRARAGLAGLLNRRIVAPALLSRYLSSAPQDLTLDLAVQRAARSLLDVYRAMRGGVDRFLETGPLHPSFGLLARQLRDLEAWSADGSAADPALVQAVFRRTREHFLTQDGEPRKLPPPKYKKATFASTTDWQAHRDLVAGHAGAVQAADAAFRRDLNVLVSRGVWRMFRIAEAEYRRTLDARALLDFPDVLLKALELLRQMEEFSQSRFRLEARYHHVLVDEFQDTSRAQWELVSLLVQAWGEGAGLAGTGSLPPSIFIVGDRKQSIYGFRDADVSLFRDASGYMSRLRPGGDVRRSISRSFRAVAPLLAFINDLCEAVGKAPDRRDGFVYDEQDRFPVDVPAGHEVSETMGLVVADSVEECARATAAEIVRLVQAGTIVRDRDTGVHRPVRPGDMAILFRTRESHREFERALEAQGIPAFVYKGLGFFDADEIQDVIAVLACLADPTSDLRAAAWLRSRFIRMSDDGLRRLGGRVAAALDGFDVRDAALDAHDTEALRVARSAAARWREMVDRLPPAELLDRVLAESAYAAELRGPRLHQARENLKKIRAIIRRIQNRGYGTLDRIVTHLDQLAVGDEANAVIDATDAVSLMTVHASKGLEFPVVFVVNLARGTGNWRSAIRVGVEPNGEDVSVSVGDFESPADGDAADREREETKRLLYVAVTRARDRLYLGSVVKDGRLKPGRGSLAEVLPDAVQDLFAEAYRGAATVRWSGGSAVHGFAVCALAEQPEEAAPAAWAGLRPGDDFAPLADAGVPRVTVSMQREGFEAATGVERSGSDGSGRLVGILVHRLLQREPLGGEVDVEELRRSISGMLSSLAVTDTDEFERASADAIARFQALSLRPDVRAVYLSGDVYHEVPFTLARQGRYIRGAIDCLVVSAGRVTVLEFKTGAPHDDHRVQTELYRSAAQALFPDAVVDARLVYAARPEPA